MSQLQRLNSRSLAWPTDWEALFGAQRPLILEIGFGQGHFLLHLARQHPEANLVGLEISNRCLTRVERALERQGLTQVRVIHSSAETALRFLFMPASPQRGADQLPRPVVPQAARPSPPVAARHARPAGQPHAGRRRPLSGHGHPRIRGDEPRAAGRHAWPGQPAGRALDGRTARPRRDPLRTGGARGRPPLLFLRLAAQRAAAAAGTRCEGVPHAARRLQQPALPAGNARALSAAATAQRGDAHQLQPRLSGRAFATL